MMNNLRGNILSSAIATAANYLVPLMVFPYVSRVFGIDGVGVVSFVDAVVTGFIIFSMMGVSVLGSREIARCGTDKRERSRVFWNLLSLHAFMAVIALIILCMAMLFLPRLSEHKDLFWIGASKVILSVGLVEWFFQGVEDFKYIAGRTLFVKALYLAAVFLFVRQPEDLNLYYFLTAAVVAAISLVNIFRLRSLLLPPKRVLMFDFVGPYFRFGAYIMLGWTYTTLCVGMLGFCCDAAEVGSFTAASKIVMVLTAFSWMIVQVLLPKISGCVARGENHLVPPLMRRSLLLLLSGTIAIVAIAEWLAPELIEFLCGDGFARAVLPFRILLPVVIASAFEQFITVQILTPLGQEKRIMRNTLIAAAFVLVLAPILIPSFGAEGTAMLWCAVECLLCVLAVRSAAACNMKSFFSFNIR